MPDLFAIKLVLVLVILALSLAIHEAAHAWVAYKRGDTTAKDLGRLTLNPIVHIDPFMTVILPAILMLTTGFVFGGAKPVPVNPYNLKHPLRDMVWVALAGPASNVLQAILFEVVKKSVLQLGFFGPGTLFVEIMNFGVAINVLLAVFNMIPIPPLDGSRVMAYLLPRTLRESYVALERFGMVLIIFFIWFMPGGQRLVFDGMNALTDIVYKITGGQWS